MATAMSLLQTCYIFGFNLLLFSALLLKHVMTYERNTHIQEEETQGLD